MAFADTIKKYSHRDRNSFIVLLTAIAKPSKIKLKDKIDRKNLFRQFCIISFVGLFSAMLWIIMENSAMMRIFEPSSLLFTKRDEREISL